MKPRSHTDSVGDASVVAATGHDREEWFARLDEAGATQWGHPQIAAWLVAERGVPGWWAQSITVGYEQARGMRLPGQRPDGTFEANASKTIPRPVGDVFPHLADDSLRAAWLDGAWQLRGVSEPRSVRLDGDGASRVTFYVTAVDDARTRVSVQHTRLADADAIPTAKAFWRSALAALAATLAH